LKQDTNLLNAQAYYTLTYKAINPMPAGSAFKIIYPSSVTVATISRCEVVHAGSTYSITGCAINAVTSTSAIDINLNGEFNAIVAAGDQI
jgi:hypothetical protein